MIALYTLLLFPFALHPAIGFIVNTLGSGKKRKAFLLAFFAGLFYDIATNHLPFGVLTLFWMFATLIVEIFRKSFFLDPLKELILGTLLFSFVLEGSQALFLGYFQFSLSMQPFYETITALLLLRSLTFWKAFRVKVRASA